MKKRRVVISGMGMITPLGHNVEENWENLLAGKSGIGRITLFDPSQDQCQIAGEVKNFHPEELLGKFVSLKEIEITDRLLHLAFVAAKEAALGGKLISQDGELILENIDRSRAGVVVGIGLSGATLINKIIEYLKEKGPEWLPRWIDPYLVQSSLTNLVASQLSIILDLEGINLSFGTACAASAHAIGEGYRSIQRNESDIIIAGGMETPIFEIIIENVADLRVETTKWNESPEKASRPFDRKRNGFVLSEGAGALILEELTHAQKREAKIYAEIIGFGQNADAYHRTEPRIEGIRDCILKALKDAEIKPKEIDYINAHATGTKIGDRKEAIAIQEVFGKNLKRVLVGSTKSMTGHLVGASGAVEAIFASLALKNGIVPPTINLEESEFDFLNIPTKPVRGNFQNALSSSFAIGGTNAVLVFERYNK